MNLDGLNPTDVDERITVKDVDFSVTKSITQAAPEMMVRELIQNGIEAVQSAPRGQRRIVVSKEIHFGAPKLCIFNTGTGMNAEELYNMGDLACTVNKEHGLDKNYGEGAKVSSLLYNSFGMIYDSCKNGSVSRIWLRKNNEKYGRRTFHDTRVVRHVSQSVLDVTNEYENTDMLQYDWTKVVLLGKTQDQDTVSDPYGSGTPLKDSWFAEYLYHRFYRIDSSIDIILHGVGHKSKAEKSQMFETIEQRRTRPCATRSGVQTGVFSRSETVNVANGIKIHFIHDELMGSNRISNSRGGLQTDVTFGGIIYKNEMYSFYKGGDWTNKCFRLGISYGGNVLSVLIELPDSANLIPDSFRRNLIDLSRDRHEFVLEEFSDLVIANTPEWVKQIIDDNSPVRNTTFDDVEKKLKNLMDKLSLKNEVEVLTSDEGDSDMADDGKPGAEIIAYPNGEPSGVIVDGPEESRKKKIAHIHKGIRATVLVSKPHPMFKIHPLTRDQDIIEKGIVGKAGLYVRNTNELFINMQYPAIERMFETLVVFYPNADRELFSPRAHELIEKHMILRVGTTVVVALSKQTNAEWDRESVDRALTSESLSMAADADEHHTQLVKSRLSAEFLSNKVININA